MGIKVQRKEGDEAQRPRYLFDLDDDNPPIVLFVAPVFITGWATYYLDNDGERRRFCRDRLLGRKTIEQAQADLDAFAQEFGLELVEP